MYKILDLFCGGGGGQGGNQLGVWRAAMGIDWLYSTGLAKAVPPAYSEYIVKEWLRSRE